MTDINAEKHAFIDEQGKAPGTANTASMNEAAGEGETGQADLDLTAAQTVRKIQEALNNAGYDCGTPDGAAGQKTAEAISNYQRDHGLEVTGRIDLALAESLHL